MSVNREKGMELPAYRSKIEEALNNPPYGYKTHSWQCLQESGQNDVGYKYQSTMIFYEEIPQQVSDVTGRKFKENNGK